MDPPLLATLVICHLSEASAIQSPLHPSSHPLLKETKPQESTGEAQRRRTIKLVADTGQSEKKPDSVAVCTINI